MFVSQSARDGSKASRSVALKSRSEPEPVDRVLLNADQVKVRRKCHPYKHTWKDSSPKNQHLKCWLVLRLPAQCLTRVCVFKALRRSLEVSVRRSNRDSAGEESEEEWIEEQIEREESSDSLPDLTLPAQPTSQPISKQLSHGDLIMLEFSPSSQGNDFWPQAQSRFFFVGF